MHCKMVTLILPLDTLRKRLLTAFETAQGSKVRENKGTAISDEMAAKVLGYKSSNKMYAELPDTDLMGVMNTEIWTVTIVETNADGGKVGEIRTSVIEGDGYEIENSMFEIFSQELLDKNNLLNRIDKQLDIIGVYKDDEYKLIQTNEDKVALMAWLKGTLTERQLLSDDFLGALESHRIKISTTPVTLFLPVSANNFKPYTHSS
jgi:hypothetical protein